jgi:RHS repeat-associated protein
VPKPAAHPTRSYHDYYPFGMEMPGRSFEAGDYRFGFNGKETDPEAVAAGSQYDYGFRIYNTGIGRFLSVDPLTASYPWYTPYQFAGNMPIWAIDLDGLEPMIVIDATLTMVRLQIATSHLLQVYTQTSDYNNPNVPSTVQKNLDIVKVGEGAKVISDAVSSIGHTILDGAGTVPVVGEVFDAINATWYAAERDYYSSALSAVSLLPIAGDIFGKGIKYSLKSARLAGDLVDDGEMITGTFKTLDSSLPDFEILAVKTVDEATNSVTLNIAGYPVGIDAKDYDQYVNQYRKQIMDIRDGLVKWAEDNGYSSINITYERTAQSTSANPGVKKTWTKKLTDKTIPE